MQQSEVMRPAVLVVDDDEGIRMLVELSMRDFADVTAVGTAAEALALIDSGTVPAVVLLDRRLPDMGGVDLAQRLRAHAATARTPIVVLTGDTLTPTDIDAAGIDDYLRKPFDIDELRARVASLLGNVGGE